MSRLLKTWALCVSLGHFGLNVCPIGHTYFAIPSLPSGAWLWTLLRVPPCPDHKIKRISSLSYTYTTRTGQSYLLTQTCSTNCVTVENQMMLNHVIWSSSYVRSALQMDGTQMQYCSIIGCINQLRWQHSSARCTLSLDGSQELRHTETQTCQIHTALVDARR